jgi:hypothetical protein
LAAKKKKRATKKATAKKPARKANPKAAKKKGAKKPQKKPVKKAAKKAAKKATKKASAKKAAPKKAPAKKAPAKKAPAKKAAPKKKTAKKKPTGAPKTARAGKVQRVGAPKPRFRTPVAPKDTIRRPEGSEELKQKLGALNQATSQIRGLKRSLNKSFFEIGEILEKIEVERLYEVKGYGSFEAFVDREIDIGKQLSLKIVRIVQTFIREAVVNAGLERATAALDALEDDGGEASPAAPPTTSSGGRSPIPFHKQ